MNETNIQTVKQYPVTSLACSNGQCLNSTDVNTIKNLSSSVNSTRHCIGSSCLVASDLSTLKSIPTLVNTTRICSGSACFNSSEISTLKLMLVNPACLPLNCICSQLPSDSTSQFYAKASNVTTYAGSGASGSNNGPRLSATFLQPRGIVVSSNGTMFITDTGNHLIRSISTTGVVSVLAGSVSGSTDGQGSAARFMQPIGIDLLQNGTLYVLEMGGNRIRAISPSGFVTTVTGINGTATFQDGALSTARFNSPNELTVTPDGSIYVADYNNNRIRKISGNTVSTFAGNGASGSNDATGALATFDGPWGITSDSSGNLYVTDSRNDKIRKITSGGVVTTIAGSGDTGSDDGQGIYSSFNRPSGITIDTNGVLYVSDYINDRIRKITPDGMVTTIAGSSTGNTDNVGLQSKFSRPTGLAISNGTLYLTDTANNAIRAIDNLC